MMRFRTHVLTVLSVVALTASLSVTAQQPQGGGEPGNRGGAPGGPGLKVTAADERPVILAVGESTTEGYGVPRDLSYPAQLQKELDQRGYRYRVVNHGVSGSTTSAALLRFDRGLALRPKIVVIALGGNDGGSNLPAAVTRANLTKMISLYRRTNAEVFLADRNVRGAEGLFAVLAKEQGAVLMPPLTAGVSGNPDLTIADERHPNAEGYTIIVANLLKVLEPYLKKGH